MNQPPSLTSLRRTQNNKQRPIKDLLECRSSTLESVRASLVAFSLWPFWQAARQPAKCCRHLASTLRRPQPRVCLPEPIWPVSSRLFIQATLLVRVLWLAVLTAVPRPDLRALCPPLPRTLPKLSRAVCPTSSVPAAFRMFQRLWQEPNSSRASNKLIPSSDSRLTRCTCSLEARIGSSRDRWWKRLRTFILRRGFPRPISSSTRAKMLAMPL